MSSNRTALYQKLFKVLKKYYQPTVPVERPVLEHLLYACCLENSMPEAADEAFALLQQYADWNEVRVTTVSELAEVMSRLRDPVEAGRRVKRCLQSIFEAKYSFDLEYLTKMPLGKAQAELQQFQGVTPFAVNYVSQHALNGHCIPLNQGVFAVLRALRIISPKDLEKQHAPGLERAINKSKGIEFASLVHQLGVEYMAGPSPRLKNILKAVVPNFEFPEPEPAPTGAADPGATAGAPPKTARTSKRAATAANPSNTNTPSVPSSTSTTAPSPQTVQVESKAPAAQEASVATPPVAQATPQAAATEAVAPAKPEAAAPAQPSKNVQKPPRDKTKSKRERPASATRSSSGQSRSAENMASGKSQVPERQAARSKLSTKALTRKKPK
jgi:endonuclease-3